ncbi:MAG: S1 RNA-binding domain-containing protein [Lachnospiraceae bacterium]|nr:S1 RNA-binding domain-containing protein [Lachnospiraceae bacterium]
MIELGKIQKLKAVKLREQGMYFTDPLDIEEEERVLLPKKQLPEDLKVGDMLSLFIYRDSSDRLIATNRTPAISLSETALLKVKEISKIGAFFEWGLEKDLLMPYAEMTKELSPGEECLCALYVDKSNRLCLTMKVYPYLSSDSPYKKEDEIRGRVYEISDRFGAFVAVDDKYQGLIPAKELFSELNINSIIGARVTEVREDGKLTLSIRKKAYLQMDEDAKKVYDIIKSFDGVLPFNDKASAETIKRVTGMSKNEFKRAVGRLYKERKIIIGDKVIRLT